MTQAELDALFADRAGISLKAAKLQMSIFRAIVGETLAAGDIVSLTDIGKLSVESKPARSGRNPKTGETIQIPSKRVVKFAASKVLKDWVATDSSKAY